MPRPTQLPLGDDDNDLQPVKLIFEKHHHCGDFIGQAQLGATPQSCSSHKFCPECHFDRTSSEAYKPFTFFDPKVYEACGQCQTVPTESAAPWSPRTMDGTLHTIETAFEARTKKERKKRLQQGGLRPTLETVRALQHAAQHAAQHTRAAAAPAHCPTPRNTPCNTPCAPPPAARHPPPPVQHAVQRTVQHAVRRCRPYTCVATPSQENYPLHPKFWCGSNEQDWRSLDLMHLEPDGNLPREPKLSLEWHTPAPHAVQHAAQHTVQHTVQHACHRSCVLLLQLTHG